jgi:hypothetical protein
MYRTIAIDAATWGIGKVNLALVAAPALLVEN